MRARAACKLIEFLSRRRIMSSLRKSQLILEWLMRLVQVRQTILLELKRETNANMYPSSLWKNNQRILQSHSHVNWHTQLPNHLVKRRKMNPTWRTPFPAEAASARRKLSQILLLLAAFAIARVGWFYAVNVATPTANSVPTPCASGSSASVNLTATRQSCAAKLEEPFA